MFPFEIFERALMFQFKIFETGRDDQNEYQAEVDKTATVLQAFYTAHHSEP